MTRDDYDDDPTKGFDASSCSGFGTGVDDEFLC